VSTRRGRHAAVQRPLPDLNGPEGNARLTGGTAAVLFLLMAAEGPGWAWHPMRGGS